MSAMGLSLLILPKQASKILSLVLLAFITCLMLVVMDYNFRFSVSHRSQFRGDAKGEKVLNPVFEINENLKQILKPGSHLENQNKCNLASTNHFLVLSPPVAGGSLETSCSSWRPHWA